MPASDKYVDSVASFFVRTDFLFFWVNIFVFFAFTDCTTRLIFQSMSDTAINTDETPNQTLNVSNNSKCQSDQCAFYSECLEQKDQIKSLQDQLDILSFEVRTKVAYLEIQTNEYKDLLAHQEKINDALQGKATVTPLCLPENVKPTCAGCVHHRNALVYSREMISSNHGVIQSRNQETERILDDAKTQLANERLINGKLRVSMNTLQKQQESTPKIKALERENIQHIQTIRILSDQLKEARELIDTLRQDAPNSKVQPADQRPSNPQKRKHHEMSPPINLTNELKSLFKQVFSFLQDNDQLLEENILYDAFLSSVHESQRPCCFEAIHKACHNGEQLSTKELKNLIDGKGRTCKSSFSACLEAMGGTVKKNGTQKLWTNIKINH